MSHWEKMLENYYQKMGWNPKGIPTKKTLDKHGIGWVWEDLKHLNQ